MELSTRYSYIKQKNSTNQITFDFKNGKLTEHHIRTYKEKEVEETYSYTVEDGKLVLVSTFDFKVEHTSQRLTEGNIVARRWFKKIPLPQQ